MIERLVVDRVDDWEPPVQSGERFAYAPPPPPRARVAFGDVRLIDRETRGVVAVQRVATGSLRTRLSWVQRAIANDPGFPWGGGTRLAGFGNRALTFGTVAPVPLRRRYGCSPCAFNAQRPGVYSELDQMSLRLWSMFQRHAPREAKEHDRLTADLHKDWRFAQGRAPWTSGIINDTAALPYHRDAGNVRGAWSAMVALRTDGDGGYLHLPEYDVWFAAPPFAVMFFNGQAAWHGVTPLSLDRPRAHRYTIVWYAKQAIETCGPAADEARRAARYKTSLDDARVAQ